MSFVNLDLKLNNNNNSNNNGSVQQQRHHPFLNCNYNHSGGGNTKTLFSPSGIAFPFHNVGGAGGNHNNSDSARRANWVHKDDSCDGSVVVGECNGGGIERVSNNNRGVCGKDEENKNLQYWAYAARAACIIAVMPILFYTKNEKITKIAACVHLLLAPVTSFFIQHYGYMKASINNNPRARLASCVMCCAGYVMGSGAAVILLVGGKDHWVNYLLTMALCTGSIQFLVVLQKENVVRVMVCTACAVVVVTLAILGSFAPVHMAKKFFQSAVFPFLLLFLETSRIR